MGVNPPKVRPDERVGEQFGVFRGDARRLEHVTREPLEVAVVDPRL